MSNPGFDLERVRSGLRTALLGETIIWHPSVDSTQEELRRLARGGAQSGTVVVADTQRAGRGRRGRTWYDRPGQDLLFTVLMPPGLPREGLVAVALGAYLAEALAQETGLPLMTQWPNDLVIGPAKVGGVLTEAEGDRYLVGIGLNVKGKATEIAQSVGRAVTTLEAALGRPLLREDLLAACLNGLARAYAQLCATDRSPVVRKFSEFDSLRGKTVTITGPQGTATGQAMGIVASGALLVRTGAVVIEVTVADEVKVQEA